MITNLRNAKSRLSELVQRAADGEEIVITVRGKPTVKLTATPPSVKTKADRLAFAERLKKDAKTATRKVGLSDQAFWDEMREDRF